MLEATHDDIISRIESVEREQSEMKAAVMEFGRQAQAAHEAATDNKKHFDEKLEQVTKAENGTHLELVEHRAEMNGKMTGLKWGLSILGFVITVGLVIIGWLIERAAG